MNIHKLSRFPAAPFVFGAAGLIPFIAGAATFIFAVGIFKTLTGLALAFYGAVILSFLGGVRWGFAVLEPSSSWRAYGLSIAPSLVAWSAAFMALSGANNALLLSSAALVFWFFIERADKPDLTIPQWYWRLRTGLTFIAATSLMGAGVFG